IIPFMEILLHNTEPELLEQRDSASFIYQWDTGIAPASYVFQVIDGTNAASVIANTGSDLNYLIDQAKVANRNCDLAVIGRLTSGTADATCFGWVFDRKLTDTTGVATFFGPDAAGLGDAARDLTFFQNAAQAGGRFAFVGMPVGTAWKWAVDPDLDQLPNQ